MHSSASGERAAGAPCAPVAGSGGVRRRAGATLVMAGVALAPLVAYRVIEYLALQWPSRPWGEVAVHTAPPLTMLGLALLLWRHVPPMPRGEGQRRASFGLSMAVGMLLGTLAASANLLLMLAMSERQAGAGMAVASIGPATSAVVAHVLVLAPVAEECAFRGLIYRLFRRGMAPVWAVLLSAAIFGVMHVQPSKALWAFLLGIVAALAYEHTRSMLTPIVIHALFNTVPVTVAVVRARPDDQGPIWFILALVALVFTFSAHSAARRQARAP